jgi:hypothetical protein
MFERRLYKRRQKSLGWINTERSLGLDELSRGDTAGTPPSRPAGAMVDYPSMVQWVIHHFDIESYGLDDFHQQSAKMID